MQAALPNPLRANPVSARNSSWPPSTITSPMGTMHIMPRSAKQHASLIPLPLSPPILKPSTKPPLSLNAPNPTTRTNFSPTSPPADFPSAFQISGYDHRSINVNVPKRKTSHSASSSMPMTGSTSAQEPQLRQRSPSQPFLPSYFGMGNAQQPPVIPLRISSIPTNNKPRKLSLQNSRSLATLKPNADQVEKENGVLSTHEASQVTPRKLSPPLRTDKELPSPPTRGEESQARKMTPEGSVRKSSTSPTARNSPPRLPSESYKRGGQVWLNEPLTQDPADSDLHEIPAHPAPFNFPSPPTHVTQSYIPTLNVHLQPQPPPSPLPLRSTTPPKPLSLTTRENTKHHPTSEFGGWASGAGQPMQISNRQKDKERKKRSRAQILIEHVDIIKDEFWERRPWILSGRTS